MQMGIDEKQIEEMVKEWFTKTAVGEWRRLRQDPYHQIEFIVTTHFLEKYLPKNGLVLDAGGGPGRYTIELAKRNYDVVLLDLVPEMLKLAKKKIKHAGVLRKVKQFVQGSVEDLSMFPNERFDAVLCLGAPLCHLLNAKQRGKAAKELVRVAKREAPIFISVISRIGLLRSILIEFPHEMQYAKHHWEVGDYVPGLQGEGFTAAHWFLPEELCELFGEQEVEILEMAGLEEPSIYSANPILNVLIRMENQAKSKYTIQDTDKRLRYISKHADLNNPEQVKQLIAKKQCSNAYKKGLCLAYNRFCLYYKIQWEMPKYEPEQHLIKIPTKEKLEMLIANAGRTMGTKLQISMETGLRPIELINLKVKDIDLDQRTIYPTTAKNGAPRKLKISTALKNRIADYIIRNKRKPEDKLFITTPRGYSKMFRLTRNKLANKLHDQSLKTIRLYDLRHYFATMLYHKTKDILLVRQQMGHKRIETTMIYTQLLDYDQEQEWTCKATTNTNEATQLIENGFEYVATTPDALMLFRKRK